MLLWTVFILFSSGARYMTAWGILGHASLPTWLLFKCSAPAQIGFHVIGILLFTRVSLKGLGKSQTSFGLGWGFLNIGNKVRLIAQQGLWSLTILKFYLKTLKNTALCVKHLPSVKTHTSVEKTHFIMKKILYLYCICCLDILEDEFYYYRQIFQFHRRHNGHGTLSHLRRE